MPSSKRPVDPAAARIAVLVAFAALVAVQVLAWRTAPDPMPQHYGAGSVIDEWGSKTGLLLPIGVVGVVIVVIVAPPWPYDRWSRAAGRTFGQTSRSKRRQAAYWFATERRAARYRRALTAAMRWFGALIIGLMAWALWQTLVDAWSLAPGASHSTMPSWSFPLALTIFCAGMVAATVRLLISLRVPPDDASMPPRDS